MVNEYVGWISRDRKKDPVFIDYATYSEFHGFRPRKGDFKQIC